jgi:hypothetical protein
MTHTLIVRDTYNLEINQTFLNRELNITKQVGYAHEKMEHRELKLGMWYLSSSRKHHWRHHYLGTQGVVLTFSFKDKSIGEKLIIVY